MWREQLSNNLKFSLANLDGEVVGFITGGPIREPIQSYDAELYAIYLLQPAQGQGMGRQLLQELATSLRSNGIQSMVVWGRAKSRKIFLHKNWRTAPHL